MGIKLVFSDIDGTLLNSAHAITPGVIGGVGRLEAAGIPFLLISSRAPDGMLPLQRQLGIRRPMVCYGGALILDGDGSALHSQALSLGDALDRKAAAEAIGKDVCCTLYSFHQWLVDDPADPWVVQEREITGVAPAPLTGSAPAGIHKLLCMGPADSVAAVERELTARYPDTSVNRSKPTYLEIGSGRATKSAAVDFLCRHYNLPAAEAMAVGDNYNDIDMLEAAGLGVAMGNGPDAVKARAGDVVPDNDHDGLLVALERHVFPGLSL